MSITVTDIITEFGAYYRNNGQNQNNIAMAIFGQTDTTSHFTKKMVDGTRWENSKATTSRVLQPFHKNFTPTGGLTFKPVVFPLWHMKVDDTNSPDDLEASWLGFLANENVKRTEWPFIRWYIEKYLIPQSLRDYENNELYKGVYAAPNGLTAGAAGTAMNGIGKFIADSITAGDITPITTGALSTTPATFCAQVETFAKGILAQNEDYASVPMKIFMSRVLVQRYKEGYRALYGNNTDFKGTTAYIQDNEMLQVVGSSAMAGRSRIWATPAENIHDLQFRAARPNSFDIQAVDRQVKLLTDMWRGFGVSRVEEVFANEQV